jgi:hypothetical protein
MPLTPEAIKRLAVWNRTKEAQYKRISQAMPGLQLVRTGMFVRTGMMRGKHYSTFMLVCSQTLGPDLDHDGAPGFYEGVIIGRSEHAVPDHKRGLARQPITVPLPEAKKPLNKRAVDLSDAQIDQIIAGWREGRSALDLPFVLAVYGQDGQPRTA